MNTLEQLQKTWEDRVERHVADIARKGVVTPHIANEVLRPLLQAQAKPLKFSLDGYNKGYDLFLEFMESREPARVDQERLEFMKNPVTSRGNEDTFNEAVQSLLSRMPSNRSRA